MIYLHMRDPPVLHLDLKSANVLLDGHDTAKAQHADCPPSLGFAAY